MSNSIIDPFNQITMKQSALKIILVDENMGRSAILRRALQDKGHEVICRLDGSSNLANSNAFAFRCS